MTKYGAEPSPKEKATYWANTEIFSAEVRQQTLEMLNAEDQEPLYEAFHKDLSFGTGGMRGIMGIGTARINIYTIAKATTALGIYTKQKNEEIELPKIAISFDSRHESAKFAKHSASILSALGFQVLITAEMRPVPILSFMIRHYDCAAGICITASHNPPAYNGFKAYWKNGAQLTPPHDHGVLEIYKQLNYTDIPQPQTNNIQEIGADLDRAYLNSLEKVPLFKPRTTTIRVVYTPIHGTGIFIVPQAIKKFTNAEIHIPESQAQPNGDFPTVSSPNPEDPESLTHAIELGNKVKADLILGTDPDTDRLAILSRENDNYTRFNGNEIMCLLMDFCLSQMHDLNKKVLISTTVSSKLAQDIANYYGVNYQVSPTGFRWICQTLEESNLELACAGEESFGFLANPLVRDKDAISSAILAIFMLAKYQEKGLTLSQGLDELYLRHGHYNDLLVTIPTTSQTLHQQNFIDQLCNAKQIAKFPIQNTKNQNNLVQIFLDQNITVSVRPSGTEPKLKIYISTHTPKNPGSEATWLEHAKKQSSNNIKIIEKDLIDRYNQQ